MPEEDPHITSAEVRNVIKEYLEFFRFLKHTFVLPFLFSFQVEYIKSIPDTFSEDKVNFDSIEKAKMNAFVSGTEKASAHLEAEGDMTNPLWDTDKVDCISGIVTLSEGATRSISRESLLSIDIPFNVAGDAL